jgi:hypothetical protein
MTRIARRIDQVLADATSTAGLVRRLAISREAARLIAPLCTDLVPGFDALAPGACVLPDRDLKIFVRSNAQATKLRQAVPRLLAQLRRNGLEVIEIKVVVQLGSLRADAPDDARNWRPKASQEESTRKIDEKSYAAALGFARKLALTNVGGPLGASAMRLRRTLETRLARIRESDQSFDQQHREEDDKGSQPGQERPARP